MSRKIFIKAIAALSAIMILGAQTLILPSAGSSTPEGFLTAEDYIPIENTPFYDLSWADGLSPKDFQAAYKEFWIDNNGDYYFLRLSPKDSKVLEEEYRKRGYISFYPDPTSDRTLMPDLSWTDELSLTDLIEKYPYLNFGTLQDTPADICEAVCRQLLEKYDKVISESDLTSCSEDDKHSLIAGKSKLEERLKIFERIQVKYSIAQLVNMSDEEFLSIYGAERSYNNLKDDLEYELQFAEYEYYNSFTGVFTISTWHMRTNDVKRITNEIIDLFEGSDIKFTIANPLGNPTDNPLDCKDGSISMLSQGYCIEVRLSDYHELTEENMKILARIQEGISQVNDYDYFKGTHDLFSQRYNVGPPIAAPQGDMVNGFYRGDINGDAKVTASDASIIFSGYKKIYKGDPSGIMPEKEPVADMNKDGVISAEDASLAFSKYKEEYKKG